MEKDLEDEQGQRLATEAEEDHVCVNKPTGAGPPHPTYAQTLKEGLQHVKYRGHVKFFNCTKGYGFIVPHECDLICDDSEGN